MFNGVKAFFGWTNAFWGNLVNVWIPDRVPSFLLIGSAESAWGNLLIWALWISVYLGVAFFYFKVIGWPAWTAIAHMNAHGCKVLPWWHVAIYGFIAFYCSFSGDVISIEDRSVDITPFVALLPILIWYLVKAKWRILYFPLLQLVVLAFWVGAVVVFFPVLLLALGLMAVGVGVTGLVLPDRHVCPNCARTYTRTGRCPYCSAAVE